MEYQEVKIKDIREGDVFVDREQGLPRWTALEDMRRSPDGMLRCDVQHHPDGGLDTRVWSSASANLFLPIRTAGA